MTRWSAWGSSRSDIDILVLAPTRWKLRQAVKVVTQVLTSLRLDTHPDKTCMGRIAKGFDCLGYHVGPGGLRVAAQTLANGVARVHQLYAQEPGEHGSARLGAYVRRWRQWVRPGLPPTLASRCDVRALGALLLACDGYRLRCFH